MIADGFVWSYSRIECFCDCPYRFFLKYFAGVKEKPLFYSSYGSFIHKLIEQYYKGALTKDEMVTKFLTDFSKEVRGTRPQESTVTKYIQCGCEYLRSFQPFRFNMIDVEKRVEFNIDGTPFVGFIDYLGEEDGELVIVDNKSRDLKPRSKRAKPTLKDQELDSMLKQLYIYSAAVKQEYGKFPKLLCFNCFRTGTFIEEPFNDDAYNAAIEWAKKQVEDIKDADDFYPQIDYFSCNFICGVDEECEYYESYKSQR